MPPCIILVLDFDLLFGPLAMCFCDTLDQITKSQTEQGFLTCYQKYFLLQGLKNHKFHVLKYNCYLINFGTVADPWLGSTVVFVADPKA